MASSPPSTPINVMVRPIGVTGNEVDCELDGPAEYMVDNALCLPNTGDYEITFQLNPAHGVSAFAAQRPFCNQRNRCPPPAGGNAVPPYQLINNNAAAKTITVHLEPVRRGVSHFRLKFNDGLSCDPIIINGTL